MRVFVTGATGFIGSAVVSELISSGHEVVGLARSDAGARALTAAGASVHRGTIEDLDCLRRAASRADGAIHTAFFHAFTHASLSLRLRVMFGGSPTGIIARFMAAALETDRQAIKALGESLTGSHRALVLACPTMSLPLKRVATESDAPDPKSPGGMRGIMEEETARALASKGVRASIVRLPPVVHDTEKQGLITMMIPIAKQKNVSAYVEDGQNRWAAVHKADTAKLFRLILESEASGGTYHAVAEEGMPVKEIAEAMGKRLNIETKSISIKDASSHFGWLAPFVAADNPISSARTRETLNWHPINPRLLADMN